MQKILFGVIFLRGGKMADQITTIIDNSQQILEAFNRQVMQGAEAIGLTAEKHAKANCPKDTGRLRNSISHEVVLTGIYIGTNVEYAPPVEFNDNVQHKVGRAHFLRDAATTHNDEYKAIMEAALEN